MRDIITAAGWLIMGDETFLSYTDVEEGEERLAIDAEHPAHPTAWLTVADYGGEYIITVTVDDENGERVCVSDDNGAWDCASITDLTAALAEIGGTLRLPALPRCPATGREHTCNDCDGCDGITSRDFDPCAAGLCCAAHER